MVAKASTGKTRTTPSPSASGSVAKTREVQVVWGGVDDSALKAEVLAALLKTDAKVYDVSSPTTPVTRNSLQAKPTLAPSPTAAPTSTAGPTSTRHHPDLGAHCAPNARWRHPSHTGHR